jgi:DNA-binding transcriptional LysR family regulator
MELSQLEAVVAIAEEGGFNKGAAKLHIAQSAVSRRIALLEDELNEKLFSRTTKRVCLTFAGETVLRYARKISQELRDLSMETSNFSQLKKGRLRIGAGMTACLYVLPPVLERFKSLYPQIDLEVLSETTETLISFLRNHILDVGVLTLPVQFPDLDVIPLPREELVVVVSTKHPTLSKRKTLLARELADQPMVLFAKSAATRKVLDAFFIECGVAPRICMEAEHVALIKPLVGINLGITILPLPAVVEEARRNQLHYLRIRDHALFREQGLVFQKSDHHPRALSELIRLFRDRAE